MDRVGAMLHPPQRNTSHRQSASPQMSPPAQTKHVHRTESVSSHSSHASTASFPGGFQPPRARQPPANADPELWRVFTSVDQDASGAISAVELQSALVNGNLSHFDLDTVKMLMTLFDTDRNGLIGFHEFVGLYRYITEWQGVFRHFDADRSGEIDSNELGEALRAFGYQLGPRTIDMVVQRFSPASLPGSGGGRRPAISFDRFVRACVSIKSLTEAFQRVDTNNDGIATISYETFMQMAISAP